MLEIHDLGVTYDAAMAIDSIDVTVGRGEIVALLGSNGAGKSSVLRAVSGVLGHHGGAVQHGSVTLDGLDLCAMTPPEIVRSGLVHVPEGRCIFHTLSVGENLRAGAVLVRDRQEQRRNLARVHDLFPVLADRQDAPAGSLSGGEQQMLAIGRALISAPKVLALDEPSLGLAPLMVSAVASVLRQINEEGTTVLLVEQNVRVALELADRAYVLETGRVVMSGDGTTLAHDPRIAEMYLGGTTGSAEEVGTHG